MSSQRHTRLPGRTSHRGTDAADPRNSRADGRSAQSRPDPGHDPVLAAARHVLMEQGPRRATLAEVARQAGVSRMTVYRRFDSFDRVISEMLTSELGAVLDRLPESQPSGDVRSQVVTKTVALTRAIAEHELVRRVLLVDPESMLPLMTQRFGQTQRAAAAHLAVELRAGMARFDGDGSIRDGDPEALALTLVTAMQSVVFAAHALSEHPLGNDVAAQLPVLVDGFLRGDV